MEPLNSGFQRDKCKCPVYNINVKLISCFNDNFTIDWWISHNRINKRIRRLSKGLPEIRNNLQWERIVCTCLKNYLNYVNMGVCLYEHTKMYLYTNLLSRLTCFIITQRELEYLIRLDWLIGCLNLIQKDRLNLW